MWCTLQHCPSIPVYLPLVHCPSFKPLKGVYVNRSLTILTLVQDSEVGACIFSSCRYVLVTLSGFLASRSFYYKLQECYMWSQTVSIYLDILICSSMDYGQCKADWGLATRLGYEHTVPTELPQLEQLHVRRVKVTVLRIANFLQLKPTSMCHLVCMCR